MGAGDRCGFVLCQDQAGVNFRDDPVTCWESWEYLDSRRESTLSYLLHLSEPEAGTRFQVKNTAEWWGIHRIPDS